MKENLFATNFKLLLLGRILSDKLETSLDYQFYIGKLNFDCKKSKWKYCSCKHRLHLTPAHISFHVWNFEISEL